VGLYIHSLISLHCIVFSEVQGQLHLLSGMSESELVEIGVSGLHSTVRCVVQGRNFTNAI
jgi:hypothetical protein